MPALIVHGEQDDFVRISHSEDVVKNYAGEKRFLKVEGGHNDARPVFVLNSISFFFRNHLIDPKDFDGMYQELGKDLIIKLELRKQSNS